MSKAFSVRHTFHNAAEDAGNGAVLDVQGLARLGIQVSYAADASASLSPSGSTSISPSRSASPSGSQSRSPSASASPSASQSLSPSASVSASPSGSASPSASVSPSASPSAAPTGTQGSVYFEASIDGSNWYQLPVTPINGGSAVTMTAAPGIWTVAVSGLALVRARLAGTVLGAVTVIGVGTVAAS